MYLLDTNVVSELRRRKPHGAVVAWMRGIGDHDLQISAATVGEIQREIEATRERDTAKATEIEAWLEEMIRSFDILDMDLRTFRCWARLMHRRSQDLADYGMIAATAIVHDLTVVTRNVRDFATFGVRTVDPFTTGH